MLASLISFVSLPLVHEWMLTSFFTVGREKSSSSVKLLTTRSVGILSNWVMISWKTHCSWVLQLVFWEPQAERQFTELSHLNWSEHRHLFDRYPKLSNSHKNNLDGFIALQVRAKTCIFDCAVNCPWHVIHLCTLRSFQHLYLSIHVFLAAITFHCRLGAELLCHEDSCWRRPELCTLCHCRSKFP